MARSIRPVLEIADNVYWVPLDLIDTAPYNPPSRSVRESLKESIKVNGQLVPIHVCRSKDGRRFELIEGHGRYACHKELGWHTIKAIVSEYIEPIKRANKYEQINTESKQHKGADKVFEYLSCKWAVSIVERSQFASVERQTGDQTVLKLMAQNGYGFHFFYNRCLPIGKWVGVASERTLFKKFCLWLVNNPKAVTECRYLLEHKRASHIDEGKAVAEILSAFRAGRVPNRAIAITLDTYIKVA